MYQLISFKNGEKDDTTFSSIPEIAEYLTTKTGIQIDNNICRKIIERRTGTFRKSSNPGQLLNFFDEIQLIKKEPTFYYAVPSDCKTTPYKVFYNGEHLFTANSIKEICNRLNFSQAKVYRICRGFYKNAKHCEELKKYRVEQ